MNDKENALLDAAEAFLKEQGADVVVIGEMSVQHQPGARRFNHELVIRFTGTLPRTRDFR